MRGKILQHAILRRCICYGVAGINYCLPLQVLRAGFFYGIGCGTTFYCQHYQLAKLGRIFKAACMCLSTVLFFPYQQLRQIARTQHYFISMLNEPAAKCLGNSTRTYNSYFFHDLILEGNIRINKAAKNSAIISFCYS